MNGILIRPAQVPERKALEGLQLRAALNNPGDRDAMLANPDAIELPPEQIAAGGVFVAEWNGAIAGFAAILPREDENTELDALFVEPTIWRRGVGRRLLGHCEEVARIQGSAALHVVGNPHAEAFYTASDFEKIGVTETRFGPGLLMRKRLDSD